ncbi:hypothetical protein ACIQAD_26570 [Streptomyces sp. NPDC088551]|uniref:hypothetical protein n=1 Tax=Streptomyces sp. NPDC088551 TaxID=3365863 RepID=UPI003828A8FF
MAIRYGHAHPDLCRDLNDHHKQLLGAEGRVIRSGLATPRLCDEMNEYLTRITWDGLWVQLWRGMNPLDN